MAVLVGAVAPPLHLAAGSRQEALTRRPRMEGRTAAAALRVGRRALLRVREATPLHWRMACLASVSYPGHTAVVRPQRQRPDAALLALAAPPPPSSRAPPPA